MIEAKGSLDLLADHDEEGCDVEILGRKYLIGQFLGMGVDSIVHEFINTRSGLAEHVAKFHRRPAEAKEFGESVMAATGALRSNPELRSIIPDEILVTVNGGYFRVQDNVGKDRDPHRRPLQDAFSAISLQHYSEAEDLLRAVLEINPSHTVAVSYLASVEYGRGNIGDAIDLGFLAVEIDPVGARYRRQLAAILLTAGFPMLAIRESNLLNEFFPYDWTADRNIVRAWLSCGFIHQASAVLTGSSRIDDADRADLDIEIGAAQRDEAAAEMHIQSAYQFVQSGDWQAARTALETACRSYRNDSVARANLGLAIAACGDHRSGAMLLELSAVSLPPTLASSVNFNAAIGYLRAGDSDAVKRTLEGCYEALADLSPLDELETWVDLPGAAVWYDRQGMIELPPERWTSVLDDFDDLLRDSPAARLTKLYRRLLP